MPVIKARFDTCEGMALTLRVDDRIRTGDRLDHKWETEDRVYVDGERDLQGSSANGKLPAPMPKCDDTRGCTAIQALPDEKCLAPRATSNCA
jgi:hypothetical protein